MSRIGYNRYPRFCVMDNDCEHASSHQIGELPGQKYTPDQQCQLRTDNQNSKACNANEARVMCRLLECSVDKSGQCNAWTNLSPGAAEGTRCGNGKVCYKSLCVKESAVPTDDRACKPQSLNTQVDEGMMDHSWYRFRIRMNYPDGSVQTLEIPCSEMASRYPSYCWWYPEVALMCAQTCQSAGIHYDGDLMANCKELTGNIRYKGVVKTCAQFANEGWCTDNVISFNCCQSCLKIP